MYYVIIDEVKGFVNQYHQEVLCEDSNVAIAKAETRAEARQIQKTCKLLNPTKKFTISRG